LGFDAVDALHFTRHAQTGCRCGVVPQPIKRAKKIGH